ncbi:hypothetical protein Emag_001210 [Eimeria magna]
MPAAAAVLWGKLRRRGGPSVVTAADLLPSSPVFPCGHDYANEGGPSCACSGGPLGDLSRISKKESFREKFFNAVGENSSVSRWIHQRLRKKQQQQQQDPHPLQQQQQQQQQPAAATQSSSKSGALKLQLRRFLSQMKEAKPPQGQDEGQQQQQQPQVTAAQPCPGTGPATAATAAATAATAAAAKASSFVEVAPQEEAASKDSPLAAAPRGTAEALAAEATQQEVKSAAAAAAVAAAEGPAPSMNCSALDAVSDSIIGEGPPGGAPEEEKRPLDGASHEARGGPLAGGPCCLDVTTKADALTGGGPPRAFGGPLACLEGLSASRAEKLLEAGGVADVVRVFLSVVEGFFGEALLDQP